MTRVWPRCQRGLRAARPWGWSGQDRKKFEKCSGVDKERGNIGKGGKEGASQIKKNGDGDKLVGVDDE